MSKSFYDKMEAKLKKSGVNFGLGDYNKGHLINPKSKLGKKYKPLLMKFVNFICETVEKNKTNDDDKFELWWFVEPTYEGDKFMIILYGQYFRQVYQFRSEKLWTPWTHWDAYKSFLSEFNKSLLTNQ